MAASASITITDHLTPALQKLARAVTDWRPFWPIARAAIYEGEAKTFAANGPGWKPLAPSTPKRRRAGARDSTARPLRASGRLLASVTGHGSHKTTDGGKMELRVGTNLEYAAAMQYGLPRRPGWVAEHMAGSMYTKTGKRTKRHTSAHRVTMWRVRAHATTLPAVPARPFLGFTPPMVNRLVEQTGVYLTKTFAQGAR